ncbi:MAG: ScyD/ScyE family protein, partial [Dehalococcoidia bacterium]
AGAGGAGICIPGPEGGEVCLGSSGAVTRIQDGRQERVATGLPSLASPEGGEATGPHDVAVRGGTVYAVVGLGADPARRADLGGDAADFGTIVQLTGGGQWRPVADVAAYETRANPAGGDVDSNPYALLAEPDRFVVADAGGNDILAVNSDGSIETLAVFFDRMTAPPPFLMLPPGAEVPMQPVPTSVVRGPDGAYYIGELTGFPFPQGGARIWRLVPGKSPSVFAEGFTNIIDLAFDQAGNLYVLEIATNGLLSMDPTGALHRIAPNGARTLVAREGLVMPGGVAVGPDGALYVSNFSVLAGEGQVVRITP